MTKYLNMLISMVSDRIFLKDEATIPTSMEWPIKDRMTWEKLKEERLKPEKYKGSFSVKLE